MRGDFWPACNRPEIPGGLSVAQRQKQEPSATGPLKPLDDKTVRSMAPFAVPSNSLQQDGSQGGWTLPLDGEPRFDL